MTQLHGPRSGDLVRSRRRHHVPAGPAERRLHRHQGSNMAECHPVGFQWVMEAKARGAKVIHVDPRFTRTSAVADLHVPHPRGHRHRLPRRAHQLHPRRTTATSASTSCTTPTRRRSSPTTSATPRTSTASSAAATRRRASTTRRRGSTRASRSCAAAGQRELFAATGQAHGAHGARARAGRSADERPDAAAPALRLPDPQAPLLPLHAGDGRGGLRRARASSSSRWPRRCATTRAASARRRSSTRSAGRSTRSACSTSAPRRSSSCCSATSAGPAAASWRCAGTRRSRARPTSRRCSTSCPAICPCPSRGRRRRSTTTSANNAAPTGWWSELAEVHRLAAQGVVGRRGDRRTTTTASTTCPRITGDHSHYDDGRRHGRRQGRGLLRDGREPRRRRGERPLAAQGPGASSSGWWCATSSRSRPPSSGSERSRGDRDRGLLLPGGGAHREGRHASPTRSGCCSGTTRRVEPPGDCRSRAVVHATTWASELRARLARLRAIRRTGRSSTSPGTTRPMGANDDPTPRRCCAEINGYHGRDGKPVDGYTELTKTTARPRAAAGSTPACYADGVNQAARRKPGSEQTWVAPEWGWAWPANRRMLYNRASADPDGPAVVRAQALRVVGRGRQASGRARTCPTSSPTRPPDYVPPEDAHGAEQALARRRAVHHAGRRQGWLFAPSGLVDGPLPTHYEPQESPVDNPLYGQQSQPGARRSARRPRQPRITAPATSRFPYVLTTYRLTEHHTAGGMSRWLPWLSELQPEMFCEVSPELAARARARARRLGDDRHRARRDRGSRAGDRADARRCASAAATIHQIGLPYHWGERGLVTRRLGQRPARRSSPTPTCTSASPRRRPATSAGRRPRGECAAGIARRPPARRDEPAHGLLHRHHLCIGCKACEVACKEWNQLPDDGFELHGHVATTTPGDARARRPWRHVAVRRAGRRAADGRRTSRG